jgi:hypothetical protein
MITNFVFKVPFHGWQNGGFPTKKLGQVIPQVTDQWSIVVDAIHHRLNKILPAMQGCFCNKKRERKNKKLTSERGGGR